MINERKLTPVELKKREDIIMNMKGNKRDLVKKYGKDAEAVMYGRATNMAKKQTENMRDSKLTELIKDALKNPKKVKEDYDGDDLESGAYGDPVDAELDVTTAAPDHTEEEAELGLEEDIDLGHEDNEPGMLQGDLYQIGKSAMEIYELLDAMEGKGEVDLPSWWQSKIFKAKEAIVGASEYLEFELKEPAIDAVVDTVAPLDIEVDPLGETVEDEITSVDDMTENQKIASKLAKQLKEIAIPSSVMTKINSEINSPKTAASVIMRLINSILDNESTDYRTDIKLGKALDYLEDLADDKEEEKDDTDLTEDKDWIQKAIKRPGALHRALGIPQDKDIPDSLIDKDIRKMDKEEDKEGKLDKKDLRFLRQLDLAKTLEKFDENVTENVSENEYFSYLNDLRDSGQTNMFGAGEYLERDFNLDKREAREILAKWMRSFDELDEGLPKGFWDKKIDAEDEDQDGKVDEYNSPKGYWDGKLDAEDKKTRNVNIDFIDRKEKNNESYNTLVNKIKKSGKSEKAAKAIAGAVASYKAKGGGKGPTSKQK